jgi:hypothetical protein
VRTASASEASAWRQAVAARDSNGMLVKMGDGVFSESGC